MKLSHIARALLAWARPRRPAPELERARIRRALASRLPPHLLKDVGAGEG